MSTDQNSTYFREVPIVVINNYSLTDVLKRDYSGIFRKIRNFTFSQPYNTSIPFTTFIYKIYGNTSIWWLVLGYNGYTHPSQIKSGTILKLPSQSEMLSLINKLNSSNEVGQVGQTVLI